MERTGGEREDREEKRHPKGTEGRRQRWVASGMKPAGKRRNAKEPWLIIGGEAGASRSITTWHAANYCLLINMLTATSPLFLSLSSRFLSLLRLSVVRDGSDVSVTRCDALSDDTEVSGVPKVTEKTKSPFFFHRIIAIVMCNRGIDFLRDISDQYIR